ncbi:MAG: hypothetical protein LUI60_01605 [Clostridia bacterium]|nr:hypothetical protein [Clostridia bacterium]
MKKFTPKFLVLNAACGLLCICIVVGALFFSTNNTSVQGEDELQVIFVWQIDSFEGGKGSRAEYLRSQGVKFAKQNNVYVEVTALSSQSARYNLENGVVPDIISYGSGMYGLESYINESYKTKVWCRGGYCLLSVTSNDFSDINEQNTVINEGKENLTIAAAMFCGLQNSDCLKPTSAYVKLINGDYKYLLGTQRDIVRLQTRGVNFYVCPITQFNDMYQNISVTAATGEKGDICNSFIEFITENSSDISSLCLFYDGLNLYDNNLKEMEGLSFEYTVTAQVSKSWRENIEEAIKQKDTDKLKSLLKSL